MTTSTKSELQLLNDIFETLITGAPTSEHKWNMVKQVICDEWGDTKKRSGYVLLDLSRPRSRITNFKLAARCEIDVWTPADY